MCVDHALRYIYSGSRETSISQLPIRGVGGLTCTVPYAVDDITRGWSSHYISAPDDLSVFRLLISLYVFADYIRLDTLRLDIVGALHLITKKMAHIIRSGGDDGDGHLSMLDGYAGTLTQCAEEAYGFLEVYDRTLSSIRAPVVELLIVLKGTVWDNKPLVSSLKDIPNLLADFFAAVGEHNQVVGGLMLPSESCWRASHRCRHRALDIILMEDVCAQCAREVKRYLAWLLYTWNEA